MQELRLLRPTVRAVVVLGGFGWQATLPALAEAGWRVPRPRPAFGHGVRIGIDGSDGGVGIDGCDGSVGGGGPEGLELFGCFHVSQRNTFTGKLTPAMLREVLSTAARAAGLGK